MNFGPNAAREVGESCPLVLKLSGLVLHTSWAGSESLSEKYSLWVEKFWFFDFHSKLPFPWRSKHKIAAKSKNQDFSTQSEYFLLKLSEPAQLVCSTSPESLSTNRQPRPTSRASFRTKNHFSDPCADLWNVGNEGGHEVFAERFGTFIFDLRTWDLFFRVLRVPKNFSTCFHKFPTNKYT